MSRKIVSLSILGMLSFGFIAGLILLLNAASTLETALPEADDPISAAELVDLETIALQKGITLQVAIERYAWNDDFALEVSKIREAFSAEFTGAEIVDAGHAWVAFAGPAPSVASEMIAAWDANHSGISVEVRTNLGFNELEKDKAIQAFHFAVYEAPEVLDVVTGYSFATGQITTTVVLEDTASDAVVDDLRAMATTSLINATSADILDSITASVVRSTRQSLGRFESSTMHMGGEELSSCTSGLVVVDSGGVRGIATAGHCGDSQSDDGTSLTFQTPEYVGEHGDFQWHTGSQDMPSDFYSGDSSSTETHVRHVSYGGVGSPYLGQALCRNGKVTHKVCQEVISVSECWLGVCNLVVMQEHLSAPGDSGGPVYMGDTAYGLHQGRLVLQSEYREAFSRAEYIDEALGINIAVD